MKLEDEQDYTTFNRYAWNKAMESHAKICEELSDQFEKIKSFNCIDPDETQLLLAEPVSIQGKKVVQLACNDGKEILSIKNLGAEYCLGVDFADAFIKQAKKTRDRANITNCEFICSKITEIPEEYYGMFDVIYISAGTLGWQQDLGEFFKVVGKLKNDHGVLFIREIHPVTHMLEVDKHVETTNPIVLVNSYFFKGPLVDEDGLDYLNKTSYKTPSYWFPHTISDVIRGCIENGFNVSSFQEFSDDVSAEFEDLEKRHQVPLSYILIAKSDHELTKRLP